MHRLRRYTIRLDGFVSLRAPLAGGGCTTVPLNFTGDRLTVNFSTSAAGSLRVGLLDTEGNPLPGFGIDDCDELFGDSVERVVTWGGTSDISAHTNRTITLRLTFMDTDVYAFSFARRETE
jgi:hypothetical protein